MISYKKVFCLFQSGYIILPMRSSKSVKVLSIATSLNQFNKNYYKDMQNKIKIQANLFEQQTPQRLKNLRFEQHRAYQYVGVKELKAYYQKARRISKDKRRDTLPLSIGLSRVSTNSVINHSLLSTWQIAEKVDKRMFHVPQTESINQISSPLTKGHFLEIRNSSKRVTVNTNASSSVKKMKQNHHNYQHKWQRQQQKIEYRKGGPSLLRLVTQTRQSNIRKQINEQKHKKQNIPERMWKAVLREQKDLKNIYDRQLTKIFQQADTLSLVGQSKLDKQRNWLDSKGQQGYKFKIMSNI